MATSRRFGPQDSATSSAILDATERVLRKRGYAAATSRNVAEEAGIKQGLVYYYYKTMDELLLATFKRRTAQGLERLTEQTGSERPLQAIWEDLSQKVDARIVFEFVALANHHEGIREVYPSDLSPSDGEMPATGRNRQKTRLFLDMG